MCSSDLASAVFFAGVVGDIAGGEVSDHILRTTGDLKRARRNVVVAGFLGSFVCLLPIFLTTNLNLIALALGAAFFCAELVIGPMWSIPMDIAGKYSGTASGLMNTGSAAAEAAASVATRWVSSGRSPRMKQEPRRRTSSRALI